MSTTLISEAMGGSVTGTNKVFTVAHVPDLNTLQVLVDGVAAVVESVASDGVTYTLTTPPALNTHVVGSYIYTTADNIDLTTLAHVKARAGIVTNAEDSEIQRLITAFSQYVVIRTGRTALNQIVAFTKALNGTGGYELRLPEWPITALRSVQIDGETMVLSTGYNVPGLAILGSLKYIGFVGGQYGRFFKGRQNVYVDWSAGYVAVPTDLEGAVCEIVAIAVKKKAWLDMKSKSTSTQGSTATTTYRDWEIPPHEDQILDNYTHKVVLS
jgi:hypothetical protein